MSYKHVIVLGTQLHLSILRRLAASGGVVALKQASISSRFATRLAYVLGTVALISARLLATYYRSVTRISVMMWVSTTMSQPATLIGDTLVTQ